MKKAETTTKRFLFLACGLLPIGLYAFRAIVLHLQGKEFLWLEEALVMACMGVLLWLLCGGPFRQPQPIPDAPPHEHCFRLRYVGDLNGFQITCPHCRQRWALTEDEAFFIRGGVYALWIVLALCRIFLIPLTLPEPWDELWILLCLVAAMYVVHGVTWLFLRRKEPEKLIARTDEEEGEGPTLHTSEEQ